MKNRKKILLLTLAIVVIAFGCLVWHEYQKDLELTERGRKANEEWVLSQKYPWRSRILESSSDLQMCRMLIYSSDLTNEEKLKKMKSWNTDIEFNSSKKSLIKDS